VPDQVKVRFMVALDDVLGCSALAAHRLDGLAHGIHGVRKEVLLWQYLRARSYSRQACAVAVSCALDAFGNDPNGLFILLDQVRHAARPLLPMRQSELAVFRLLDPEWCEDAVRQGLVERGVVGRISDLDQLADVRPLAAPFLEEDDLSEIDEIIRLRNECRAVPWELMDVLPRSRASFSDIVSTLRAGDSVLARLIEFHPEPARVARDLKVRFYDVDRLRVGSAALPAETMELLETTGGVLDVSSFPWLSGRDERGLEERPAWWV